jgi:type IV secretion system protein TrbL
MIDTSTLASCLNYVILVGIPGPGDIADAIFGAFQGFIKSLFEGFFKLTGIGLTPLLKVVNPATSTKAVAAWQSSFKLAVALFPLMIVVGLLSMPWADREKAHLWRQGFRIVSVILIIAISKPVVGVGVDAMNAVTMQIAPDQFRVSFDPAAYGIGTNIGGTMALIAAYFAAAVLMLIATPLSIFALALRTYIVYIVFLGAPIWAVMWYPDWGFGVHIHKFAAKVGRMGVYSLLAGPLLAAALRGMDVIMAGGVVQAGSGSGATKFWTQLVLVCAVPFVLVAIVFKTISWAGQPMGIGKAVGMVTTAAMAAGGAAAGAAAGKGAVAGADAGGSAAGAVSASGGGGGGSGSRRRSGSGGSGGSSSGTTPRAAIDNGKLGDQMDGDVQSAGKGRPPSYFDDAAVQAAGVKESAKSMVANNRGTKYGKSRISDIRTGVQNRRPSNVAQSYKEDADWLKEQVDDQSVDLAEAHERGILDEEPKYDKQAEVRPSGEVRYQTSDGDWTTVNMEDKHEALVKNFKVAATRSHSAEKAAAATAVSMKAGKKGGKATGKTGAATLRAGAYGMGGYAPVMAHDRAKQKHSDDEQAASRGDIEKAATTKSTRKQTQQSGPETSSSQNSRTQSTKNGTGAGDADEPEGA